MMGGLASYASAVRPCHAAFVAPGYEPWTDKRLNILFLNLLGQLVIERYAEITS